MERYLIAFTVLAGLMLGIEQYGEHRVQVEWDKDKAVRAALLNQAVENGEKNAEHVAEQLRGYYEHALSKEGRTALNRWLKSHGLLPDGAPVRGCADQSAADSSSSADGASGEQWVGGSLEEFATNCALDAQRLTDWQALCREQGCEVR